MKKYQLLLLLLILFITCPPVFSQSSAKTVYVIVHGAWGGSWAFKKADSLLREQGCIVYRPSLTGQGERVHLATKEVGLMTHIKDVVNMILFEDLYDVILVGHSYGGMVVTGVADSVPGRIKKLIYLDAMVPENGESVLSIPRPTGRPVNTNDREWFRGSVLGTCRQVTTQRCSASFQNFVRCHHAYQCIKTKNPYHIYSYCRKRKRSQR